MKLVYIVLLTSLSILTNTNSFSMHKQTSQALSIPTHFNREPDRAYFIQLVRRLHPAIYFYCFTARPDNPKSRIIQRWVGVVIESAKEECARPWANTQGTELGRALHRQPESKEAFGYIMSGCHPEDFCAMVPNPFYEPHPRSAWAHEFAAIGHAIQQELKPSARL